MGKKRELKFNITLNEEQKLAKGIILANKVSIVKGAAGSGKTLLAVAVALDQLMKGQIKRIIVTRPLVTSGNEELGFLPGDIHMKTLPYLMPIYDNMYSCLDKVEIDALIADGTIEVCPIAYLKGRTFCDAVVIIDEAQNATHQQTEALLTRLGKGSRMIVCGDANQCDLKEKKFSGFPFLKKLATVTDVAFIDLKANHRDCIVEDILKVYDEFRD